jgi:NitT/TauT family transport system substrate-binding protein
MRFVSVGLAAGLALLFGTAGMAAEKVTMQFGWVPGGDRAAYYLAKEAGLFAAEDLDVQLMSGKGSNDAITKVATGVADFGEGGLDALLRAKLQNDVPVTAVMPVFSKAPDALFTTEASGIKSLKDVAGKKVATSPFTSSNGPWPFLLLSNGVDPEKVTLIKADPNALAPMLATGQVDAIIAYVTNEPAIRGILKEGNKTMVMLPWAEYGLSGYSSSLFVSNKTLATRRDVVVRFVRALKKAELMMQADPDKAAAAVKALVPEIDVAITAAVARATLPLIFNENTTRDGLGVFSPELVKTTWEWVAKQEKVSPEKLDPTSAVDIKLSK